MDGRLIIRVVNGDREGESGGRMIPEESIQTIERATWALELRVTGLWYIPRYTEDRRHNVGMIEKYRRLPLLMLPIIPYYLNLFGPCTSSDVYMLRLPCD